MESTFATGDPHWPLRPDTYAALLPEFTLSVVIDTLAACHDQPVSPPSKPGFKIRFSGSSGSTSQFLITSPSAFRLSVLIVPSKFNVGSMLDAASACSFHAYMSTVLAGFLSGLAAVQSMAFLT